MGAPSSLAANRSIKTGGRPTIFTDRIAQKICALKARGSSIQRSCDTYADLPDASIVYQWIAENRFPRFTEMYRRAQAVAGEMMADTLIEYADQEPPRAIDRRVRPDGTVFENERIDPAAANLLKTRLGARQWWLSRMMPERFGDFLHLVKKEESKHTIRFEIDVPGFLAGMNTLHVVSEASTAPAVIEHDPQVVDKG